MIELIRAVYERKPLPEDDFFYHRVLKDIKEDGIASQVYYLLKEERKIEQTPEFFQSILHKNYEKALFQNLFIKSQQNELLQRFEQQGMDVIPLKGIHFAEKVFGHLGARATSDIDLLIRMEDLEKAIEVVNLLGFTVEGAPIPGHFHCSFSKVLPHSTMPLVIELHWSLVKQNTSRFQINDIWKHAKTVEGYKHIKELTPNHTFYMICLHGWRHNLDTMKYFLDLIQVLCKYNDELDLVEILKLAKAHQTYKRMIRTLSILYLEFPFLEEIKPFDYKRDFPLWKYRNAKGLKKYLDFFDYQLFSYDTTIHSLIELFHLIFPSKYDLEVQIYDHFIGNKTYWSLYKNRLKSIIKIFVSN
ncbi:nucleotidyltransferase family protein [Neobacillus sp. M.A.Huq-85]